MTVDYPTLENVIECGMHLLALNRSTYGSYLLCIWAHPASSFMVKASSASVVILRICLDEPNPWLTAEKLPR